MSRTRRGPTRHTLRCLRSRDILDPEVDVFRVIRSLVLAYTDLNFQNNLLGDLHCQAILHTPSLLGLKQGFTRCQTCNSCTALTTSTWNSAWLPRPTQSIYSSSLVLSSTHLSLKPVSFLVLPLGFCPRCGLGLQCFLSPVCLAKCHPSVKVKLTFQCHHFFSYPFL